MQWLLALSGLPSFVGLATTNYSQQFMHASQKGKRRLLGGRNQPMGCHVRRQRRRCACFSAENLASSRTAAGEAFFIQNNEPIAFRDFCLAIWAHFGHTPPFETHIPKWLACFTGLVSETLTWISGKATTEPWECQRCMRCPICEWREGSAHIGVQGYESASTKGFA
ncbi:hypothetical protein BDW74DRAFT_152545 [Aspergillus multicolor]|uniref:uncharacterized protein n=1 Tax=Aspergillus multicolor TaxID=41759 RepID=UPI003CCD36F9